MSALIFFKKRARKLLQFREEIVLDILEKKRNKEGKGIVLNLRETERNNYGSERVSVHAQEDMKNGKRE